MQQLNFLEAYQKATKRDYVARIVQYDKAECAEVAKKYGQEYWDGPPQYGYGGNHYDGRWLPFAQDIARHYGLKAGDKILDIGCGKAFLLYEFTRAVPGIEVAGIDISEYGIATAKDEMRPYLKLGNVAEALPWADHTFDFVFSVNMLHVLKIFELKKAIQEIERVGKGRKWICVQSYRTERERANMMLWQLTCMSMHAVDEWEWLLNDWGYTGDVGFSFFE